MDRDHLSSAVRMARIGMLHRILIRLKLRGGRDGYRVLQAESASPQVLPGGEERQDAVREAGIQAQADDDYPQTIQVGGGDEDGPHPATYSSQLGPSAKRNDSSNASKRWPPRVTMQFFRFRELALKYSPEGKRKRMEAVRLATKLRLGLVALRISE